MKKCLFMAAFAIGAAAFLAGSNCHAFLGPDIHLIVPVPKPVELNRMWLDSRTLYIDQGQLITRVNNIEQFLNISAKALGLLETMDTDVTTLEGALRTLSSTAEAAQSIPQASEKAKKIKETLAVTQKKVTVARQRLDAIVLKTKPVREKMTTAAEKAKTLELALIGLNEGLIKPIRPLAWRQLDCLNQMDPSKRECATANVSKTANNVDQVLMDYDSVVKKLIDTPDWLPSLSFLDPLNADLHRIDPLSKEIENLKIRVETLAQQLSGVTGVLDKKFSFGNPCSPLLNCRVSISGRDILKGYDKIIDEIKKIIGKAAWTALDKLGVRKYVDDLVNQANNAMDSALKAVNFDVNLNLPDMSPLGAFERDLSTFTVHLDALTFPTVGQELPGFGFPGMDPHWDLKILDGSFPFGLKLPNGCTPVSTGCN